MKAGIGVSKGIAIGKSLIMVKPEIISLAAGASDIEYEIKRVDSAIKKSIEQLEEIGENVPEQTKKIIETHIMMIQDPEIYKEIIKDIKENKIDAVTATHDVLGLKIAEFKQMEDKYFAERAIDLEDIRYRMEMNILGQPIQSIHDVEEPSILIAEDVPPSLLASINPEKIIGIITEKGGTTSHTAIMANIIGIPAIVGVHNIAKKMRNNVPIGINGETAEIIVYPKRSEIERLKKERDKYKEHIIQLEKYISKPTYTKDKKQIYLYANIGNIEGAKNANKNGAEGIGLFRTEFLYLDREDLPSEEEQYRNYSKVIKAMNGKIVTARTLDIGADKQTLSITLPKESNPFLGYRAIRLCLDKPDIFKTQLKALLRAAAEGPLKVMYPMISSLEEFLEANEILEVAKLELEKERKIYDKNMPIGITVETPAAAIMADELAEKADFFSIGTNDLVQYTTAVDRMNDNVAHLYNPLNPAVIKLINKIVRAAKEHNIPVGLCGEIARDTKIIPLLIGMGIKELSMNTGSILEVRHRISTFDSRNMEEMAREILKYKTTKQIKDILENNNI